VQQLTGLDATFLAMETPEVFGHVGSVCVLDPSTAPRPLTRAALTAHIKSRLHLVPLLNRRLLTVPFGLDQPYWVDAVPDLSRHILEVALPRPGGDHQLAELVAQLHAVPLDRSRPLWELHLITGLRGARKAIYSKVHHASMDGVSGDDVLAAVLDVSPEGRQVEPPRPHRLEQPPGRVALLARSALSLLRQPARAARVGAGLLRSTPGLAAAVADRVPVLERLHHPDVVLPHGGLRTPHTPFNATITGERSWAFADLSLVDVKKVKTRAHLTVNDVVMALCAGALRRWLQEHDALPDEPLVAAVPVSVRRSADDGTFGNQLSMMFAGVPTNLESPGERLTAVGAAMQVAKSEHGVIPPTLLGDVTGFALPVLANPGWWLSSRLRLLERANPFNLFISNVPGPRIPVYYAGALLLAYYPASAIVDGQGLNITVMSYRDRLCFGLLGCRSLVPDIERLAGWLADELELLVTQSDR
jgi:diacylglycerol O-acyltransferase / wax synthase